MWGERRSGARCAGQTFAPDRASAAAADPPDLGRALTVDPGMTAGPRTAGEACGAGAGQPVGADAWPPEPPEWSPEHKLHPCHPGAAPLWLRVPWHVQPLLRSYDALLDTLTEFSLDLAALSAPARPAAQSGCGRKVGGDVHFADDPQHAQRAARRGGVGPHESEGERAGGRPPPSCDVPAGMRAVQQRRNWVRNDVHDPCMVMNVDGGPPALGEEVEADGGGAGAGTRVDRGGADVAVPLTPCGVAETVAAGVAASGAGRLDGAGAGEGGGATAVDVAWGGEVSAAVGWRAGAAGGVAKGSKPGAAKVIVLSRPGRQAAAAAAAPRRCTACSGALARGAGGHGGQQSGRAAGDSGGDAGTAGSGGEGGTALPQVEGVRGGGAAGGGDADRVGRRTGRVRQRLVPPPPKGKHVVIDVPAFDSELGFTQGFYDDSNQTMYIM